MKTVFALLLLATIADSAIAATPASNADTAKQAASAPAAAAPAAKPAATTATPAAKSVALPPGHVPVNKVEMGNTKVDKAKGPDARTVAEINTKRVELKDKTVVVHAKVVKFSPEILKKNWVHLRDGSGSDADNTNDILVTTNEVVKAGDIVTVKGIVRNDKDFGSGYSYKVMIEDGAFKK